MKLEIDLTESEIILLRILSSTHQIEDEEQTSNNKAYLQTKISLFNKIKLEIDKLKLV